MEKQKAPYLNEIDWAILFFVLTFLGVIAGIRLYTHFTKQPLPDPVVSSQTHPQNSKDPVDIDSFEPSDSEKNPQKLPSDQTLWTHLTEEIEIRGEQIVCKEEGSEQYEILDIHECLGQIEIEEENSLRKRKWLEFPNRKRVLWENEKIKEAFEKNASLEVLYKIDYAKYSGNVQNEEKK